MKIALIGAGSGFGLALAKALLAREHNVYLTYHHGSNALEAMVKAYPETLEICQADITKQDAMEFALRNMPWDELDSLVITAGVLFNEDRRKLLQDQEMDVIWRTFAVNFFGVLQTLQLFMPRVKSGGKLFVTTSEGVALDEIGTWIPSYALSKAAATKLCGVLMASQDRVEIYAVHPGRMNTEMGRQTAQIEPEETAAYFVRLIEGDIPLSRENWYINYTGESLL